MACHLSDQWENVIILSVHVHVPFNIGPYVYMYIHVHVHVHVHCTINIGSVCIRTCTSHHTVHVPTTVSGGIFSREGEGEVMSVLTCESVQLHTCSVGEMIQSVNISHYRSS